MGIGLVTSFKRVYVGFMQGKRVFATYGEEVASLMRKVLLITQVGIRTSPPVAIPNPAFHFDQASKFSSFNISLFVVARDIEMKAMVARHDDEDEEHVREDNIWKSVEQICDEDARREAGSDDPSLDHVEGKGITGSLSQSHQMQIIELLGDWEDPDAEDNGMAQVEVSTAT